jgi:hypothetical protein
MENNIKNTICKQAWNYPIVNLANNEVSMCCHSRHHKVTVEDISRLGKDIFTKFEPIRQAKLDLLNGVQTENCSYCWSLEKNGQKSSRSTFDEFSKYVFYSEHYKGKTMDEINDILLNLTNEQKTDLAENLDYVNNVEIALGNTCDLKCVYCNEFFSTQWIAEKIKYKEIPVSFIKDVDTDTNNELEKVWWEWFNESVSKKTSIVGFIGGEPLIISKLYEYLDRILGKFSSMEIKRPLYISVVTNFNTPSNYFEKFIKLIPSIASTDLKLDLNVSLESLGARTEFIRTGTKWDRLKSNVEETLLTLSKLENKNCVSFNFMLALNSLCISDLPNFIKWVIELQQKYGVPINLRGSPVVYPGWLSPSTLPLRFNYYIDIAIGLLKKEKVNRQDYLFGPWDEYIQQLTEVKKGVGTNKELYADFVNNIDTLSERRGLSFENTFPEMMGFYNECKKKL